MNPENNMEDIPTELEVPVTSEVVEETSEPVVEDPVVEQTTSEPQVNLISTPEVAVEDSNLSIPVSPSIVEPVVNEQVNIEEQVVQNEPIIENSNIVAAEPIVNNVMPEPQIDNSTPSIVEAQPVANEQVSIEPTVAPVIEPQVQMNETPITNEQVVITPTSQVAEPVSNFVEQVPLTTQVGSTMPQEFVAPVVSTPQVVEQTNQPFMAQPITTTQQTSQDNNSFQSTPAGFNQTFVPQNTESYNPPESIEIESNQQEMPKKQLNKSTLITIIIVVLILGVGSFIGYKMITKSKKLKVEQNVPSYKYSKLEVKENFDEAYDIKVKELSTEDDNDNVKYVVNEGIIEYTTNEKTFKLSVANANIQNIALIDSDSKGDYIGFLDDENNYYFATIINITKDTELTKENVNLITISEENNIKYVGIGHYQNRDEVFFFVRKSVLSGDGEEETTYDYYVDTMEETPKLFPIKDKVYVGLDIPMNTLDVSDKFLEKLSLDGVGLFYEGNIYLYSGTYESIKEFELSAKDDKAFKAKEIYVLYSEKENKLDLFIINEEDDGNYLYIVDLLKIEDLEKEEFDINSVGSKIKNYSFKTENGKSSVYIEFEDGKNIKY